MIPAAHITHWSNRVPWPTRDQVEQDLILSRLIIGISSHIELASELVFRGGTCLHKLHLPAPLRYSEDLDYVRVSRTPIGPVFDALRDVGAEMGFSSRTEITVHPKIRYSAVFDSGIAMRIKVEINTHETSPARPLIRIPHVVESPWWAGRGDVLTFTPTELLATKLRALHQRRKGRDLFDLWLGLTHLGLDPLEIVACLAPYRPSGYTSKAALATFNGHMTNTAFRRDMEPLVAADLGYDIEEAAQIVATELLELV